MKKYRIAFSYAGEKRDFVARVARILADRFGEGQILYDKYHASEFARSDLAFYLPELYHSETDLVVAVLCKEYQAKEWCGLEWNAIYGLLRKKKAEDVMLLRFDLADGPGLFGNAGFLDLDNLTPEETATRILERLASNEGLHKDHYRSSGAASTAADWPEVAPALTWPVADHREAQGAFAELITRGAKFRLLPICGGSETGKSHLSKQFLGNALAMPRLICGRLDFKGSTDIGRELATFAERLRVERPDPATRAEHQLAQIFASLSRTASPTLLIFDTFELAAGEAERWVKENLLLSIVREKWLRVIVIGQKTTKPFGEPWAAFSAPPIELHSPSPQEWFDYGKSHNTEVDLEFVQKAHNLSKGKSSLMAQLLGPPG